jgi:two-component system, NtrC family, nitrogen regulation response regulator NtrX
VGSDKKITVDVRVIAATNKDMKEEIEANRFREDLYHRISVILIHVPTLNERLEDIPFLPGILTSRSVQNTECLPGISPPMQSKS